MADPGDFAERVPEGHWYRLVPSRFPPVQLWDRVASPDELHAVAAIESYTNTRLDLGRTSLVPRKDWLFGDGTSPVMAAFCHPNTSGSRFSSGQFGIYYAASSVGAAADEVAFHRLRWYRDNRLPARTDTFRCYVGSVVKPLVDIRNEPAPRRLHDPDDWSAAQAFGAHCRGDDRWGIQYQSLRSKGADCVALLRPPASTPVIQSSHRELVWDGNGVSW